VLQRAGVAARSDIGLSRRRRRLRRRAVSAGELARDEQPTTCNESGRVHEPGVQRPSNYSRVAFETDLPRIEAPDSGGICDRTTGADCVNPPPGANFYPIYTTGTVAGGCIWQEGGPSIPGTTNTLGGNSTAQYGPLLQLFYPVPGGVTKRYNDFRNTLNSNPCPA